jgi:hypothetical protein
MTQKTETRPGGAGSAGDTCLRERLPDNAPPQNFQAHSSDRAETGGVR